MPFNPTTNTPKMDPDSFMMRGSGSGSLPSGVRSFEFSYNPGLIAGLTTTAKVITSATVPALAGLAVGDIVFLSTVAGLSVGAIAVGAYVSAPDTLTITYLCPVAIGVTLGSQTYRLLVLG